MNKDSLCRSLWMNHNVQGKKKVNYSVIQFSSVTQSYPTLCNPNGLQHAKLPYPSPVSGVCADSCLLSR